MAKIPKTLLAVIEEEPERFTKYYLKPNVISKSSNPYKKFLNEFKKEFGKKQGLYLMQYIIDNYNLANKFYNFEKIQSKLPNKFKGNLDKDIAIKFFEDYKKNESISQDLRERRIKKTIKVPKYSRNGKSIKGYSKTFNTYSDIQKNFIIARQKLPNKRLADEFNRAFETSVTTFGIRDKKLRILGKKK